MASAYLQMRHTFSGSREGLCMIDGKTIELCLTRKTYVEYAPEVWEQNSARECEEASGDDCENLRQEKGVVALLGDLFDAGGGHGADVDGAGREKKEVGGRVHDEKEAAAHL